MVEPCAASAEHNLYVSTTYEDRVGKMDEYMKANKELWDNLAKTVDVLDKSN